MGRIDEALRRSGRIRRDSDPQRSAAGPFVSPWNGADGESRGERVSRVAPAPVLPPRQVKAHRLEPSVGVERFAAGWRERLAIGGNSHPLLADQFRRLAATLLQVQRTEKLRSVMVTSALPGDGKTLTAVNLSLVLSESYRRRVLLVEADLRRPAITRVLGVPMGAGLSEALKSSEAQQPSLVQLTPTLTVLPAGQPDSDPLSVLTSSRLQVLLQDAAEKFDWVIVDAPPLAATTDATLLCPLVDGVLLVVRAGRTPLEGVNQAIESLGRERILGIVLNGTDETESIGYEYASYGPVSDATSLNLTAVADAEDR